MARMVLAYDGVAMQQPRTYASTSMRSFGFWALVGVLGGVTGGVVGLSMGCSARGSASNGPAVSLPIADPYRDTAHRIVAAALADEGAYRKLAYLTDRIGHRLSGSGALDEAIAWAQREMTADGHENVHAEKVMVPHWVRGEERGDIISPVSRPLALLALGSSAGTPADGVEADAVVVHDFDELAALGPSGVTGKIVVFNHPMPPFGPGGAKYDET